MINALNNTRIGIAPLAGPMTGHPAARRVPTPQTSTQDVVDIHKPRPMSDAEVTQAMDTVQEIVEHNPDEALSAHSGLDYNRVMALLGMG